MNLNAVNTLVKATEIRIHSVCLGEEILGLVYYSGKGRYHIFLCNRLTQERKREILTYEIYHILKDMPRKTYIIGLDMQEEPLEIQTANYVRSLLRHITG